MRIASFTTTVAFAVLQPARASDEGRPRAAIIAADAISVFKARCAVCHGPQLTAPKGRFGYVLDLGRLAANPELIVPFRAEESELLALIEHDEMPPLGAQGGPLTQHEKAVVRKWIDAGAPAVARSADVTESSKEDADKFSNSRTEPFPARVFAWVGKLHLLLLHFPIAFAVVAAVAEAMLMLNGRKTPSRIIRIAVWIAAGTATPTACLGWVFAATAAGAGPPGLLAAHRWSGTAAAAVLLLAAFVTERDMRRGTRTRVGSLILLAAGLATAAAGHLGGLLARGPDFFAE